MPALHTESSSKVNIYGSTDSGPAYFEVTRQPIRPCVALFSLVLSACTPGCDAQCDKWSPGGIEAAEWKCIPSSPTANPPDCSDTAPNTLTVMADETQKITLSGTLAGWDYSANVAGKTSLMIWRQGPTPTGFTLVCSTEVTATAPGLQHAAPDPATPPCEVTEGDYFGMWQSGAGVIGIRWASFEDDGIEKGSLAVASQSPGISTEPTPGKAFTIQKVGSPRS